MLSQIGQVSQTSQDGQVSQMKRQVTTLEHRLSQPLFDKRDPEPGIKKIITYLLKADASQQEVAEMIQLMRSYHAYKYALECEEVGVILEQNREEWRLRKDLDDFISTSAGDFNLNDCYQVAGAQSKTEKARVRQILHRMSEKNILKKHGSKAGIYRKVENEVDRIEWMDAESTEFPLILPLGIHNYVKIQPKNLIVVAGSANSGKTAFLLNIVKDNMFGIDDAVFKDYKDKDLKPYTINYFSSEMSENEFKERITNFGDPSPENWTFNAFNRCGNFADVIDPDAINIIDFLELHDEFWKVGGMMKDIYEKLDKGIAIIALQKNPGAKVGRGGSATMEKPRLYISMEAGKLCLEKAKNWRHSSHNPNNMICEYKLVKGAVFIKEGMWDWRRD